MTYKNCCIHAVIHLVLDVTYLNFSPRLKVVSVLLFLVLALREVPSVDRSIVKKKEVSVKIKLTVQHFFGIGIERFRMTPRRPYWCPKTMKRWPCWCPKPVLWELNSFLMQTLSFVPRHLHRCRPRE